MKWTGVLHDRAMCEMDRELDRSHNRDEAELTPMEK
jgi:hypothetical protein